nr:hypothetical protein [Ktedonobacteraceae bacterium]
MSKLWDDMLKRMFTANPQHFLTWLVPNAVLLHELSPELKTPSLSDLKAQHSQETRDLTADILYVILWYGVQTILHIEFQRRGDKEMGKRRGASMVDGEVRDVQERPGRVLHLSKDTGRRA